MSFFNAWEELGLILIIFRFLIWPRWSFNKFVFLFKNCLFTYVWCIGSSLLSMNFLSCGKQGPLSSCGLWASRCGGLSCHRAQAPGHAGFRSCGSQALEHRPIVVVYRLGCWVAHGILLDQGSNLCLLYWQMDRLPLSHQGSPTGIFLSK